MCLGSNHQFERSAAAATTTAQNGSDDIGVRFKKSNANWPALTSIQHDCIMAVLCMAEPITHRERELIALITIFTLPHTVL